MATTVYFGDYQSNEMKFVQDLVNEIPVVGPVASKLVSPLATLAGSLFNEFMHDTPPIKESDPTNYALANIPRRVSSLAISANDVHPDSSEIIASDESSTNLFTDILARCKIPTRIRLTTWLTTTPAGTLLMSVPVNPGTGQTTPSGGFDIFLTSPLSYYAQLFSLWRGGLRFTVECVASQFHQGQLYLAFNPALGGITLSQATNCTAATIDLSETNRTSLDVPYVTISDYLHTYIFDRDFTAATDYTDYDLGTFNIFVQNPLITNGTVSNQIDINVYIEALDDFEFKYPRGLAAGIEFYTSGAYQMNEEVVSNERVNVQTQGPHQTYTNTTNRNVAVAANVVTADSNNVLEREYLVRQATTIPFTTAITTVVSVDNFPDTYFQQQLATYGLRQYHEFYRMNFKITIRINPTPFNQGMLLLYWNPLKLDMSGASLGTLTQLPHAFLNVATETSASMIVPYSSMCRVLRDNGTTEANYGTVEVIVWNQLHGPSTAPQNLYYTLWAQALDVHIAVKHAAAAVVTGKLQMNTASDSSREVSTTQVAYKKNGADLGGFIHEKHDNVLTLLRRKCNAGSVVVANTTGLGTNRVMNGGVFVGREHIFLLDTYLLSGGSNRITFSTNLGRIPNATMWCNMNPTLFSIQSFSLGTTVAAATLNVFNGSTQWYPSGEQQKEIEIPYYARVPLVRNGNASFGPIGLGWPTIRVFAQNLSVAGSTSFNLFAWHSVGDDFKIYFPIVFSVLRRANTLAAVRAPVNEFRVRGDRIARPKREIDLELAKAGDVESNPGPDLVTGEYQGLGDGMVDRAIKTSGMTETVSEGRELIRELRETVPHLQGAATSIQQLANQATTLTDNLNERVLPKVNTITNTIASAIDNVKGTIGSGLDVFVKYWAQCAEVLLDVFSHVGNIIVGNKMRFVSMAALVLKLGKYLSPLVLNKLESELKATGSFQGPMEFVTFAVFGVPVVKFLLALWDFEMGDNDEKSFVHRLNTNLEGLSSFKDRMSAVIMTVGEYIFEGTGFCTSWYQTSARGLIEFHKEVGRAIEQNLYTAITVKDFKTQYQLKKLMKEAEKIRSYGPTLPKFNQEYMKSATKVMEWAKLLTIAKEENTVRCQPIGLGLVGESHVGKSWISAGVLPAMILMRLGRVQTGEEVGAKVWHMPTGADTHFYDGYTQQEVVCIDDFLKTTEAKDAQDVINMISSSQYAVDMAKLEEKGMKFRSNFIIVTSNIVNFAATKNLSHPDALCNRFKDHVVVLTVKKGNASQNIQDISAKLSSENLTFDEVCVLVDECWTFKRLDVKTGNHKEVVLFKDYVDSICRDHLIKSRAHQQVMTGLKNLKPGEVMTYEMARQHGNCVLGKYQADDGEAYYSSEESECEIRFNVQSSIGEESCSVNPFVMCAVEDYVSMREDEYWEPVYKQALLDVLRETEHTRGDKVFDFSREVKTYDDISDLYYTLTRPKGRVWVGMLKIAGIVCISAAVVLLCKQLLSQCITYVVGAFQGASYEGLKIGKPKPRVDGLLQGVSERNERIRKNIRRVDIFDVDDQQTMHSMHVLMLSGKDALVPWHFWNRLVKLRQSGMNVFMRIENFDPHGNSKGFVRVGYESALVERIMSDDGVPLDLCVMHMHNVNVNQIRHVQHFIATIKEHRNLLCGQEVSALILARDDLDDFANRIGRRPISLYRDSEGEEMFMMICEPNRGQSTHNGDCGRPYVVMDPSVQRPLVGIHSAIIQNPTPGLLGCTPLVWEWIEKARLRIPAYAALESDELKGDGSKPKQWKTDVFVSGKMQINGEPLVAFTPTHTSKREWLEHPEWEKKYMPSFKGMFDDKHALYDNVQKHEVHSTCIVPFRACRMMVRHFCKQYPADRDKHVFSEHEAINGVQPMLSLVMNTSPGFIGKYFKDGKHELFDGVVAGDEKQVFSFSAKAREFVVPLYGRTFVEHLHFVESELQEGRIPVMPWVATLKDELRSIEKVKAGKTRVFEQPPFEFTILVRKYFGAFLNYIKMNPGNVTHAAIGIDKEAKWADFYRELKLKGNRGFDVDYSNYDGTVCSQAFDFFREVTDEYYGDRNLVRHGLLSVLQNSWVVAGEYVFFTEQGNKSGNPMTDVFNSVTNMFVIYSSYLDGRIRLGEEYTLEDFDRDVCCLTYGDDVIISADNHTLKYFNRVMVAAMAMRLGMKVTAANKSDILEQWEMLEDLTFLKSKFAPKGAIVLAPMPTDVAIKQLQYIDKRNVRDARIKRDLVENAMRFVSHHGKDAALRLERQLADLGIRTIFSYEDFILDIHEKQRV